MGRKYPRFSLQWCTEVLSYIAARMKGDTRGLKKQAVPGLVHRETTGSIFLASAVKKTLFFVLLLFLCLFSLFLIPFSRDGKQELQQQALASSVQVNVSPADPSFSVSPGFVGFSIEASDMCNVVNVEQKEPVLEQLFRNLGPAIMRYGGSSVENVYWSPNGVSSCSWNYSRINKSLIYDIFAFAKKVGWKVILDMNLKNGDPASAADEAAYAASVGGSNLLGVEIGNEPELYGWSYSTYRSKWETLAASIKGRTPNIPLAGPSGTLCCADFFTPFIKAEGSKLAIATDHWYPEFYRGSGAQAPTIDALLSSSLMKRTISTIRPILATSEAKNLPYYLAETNAIAGTPQEAVGHSFAMALWGLDYMFTAADLGVAGMAFHGGYPGDGTSPLGYSSTSVTPRALYYGMLLFHYAAVSGNVIPTQIISSTNVTAHSVLNDDGKLRVIIINKGQKDVTVQVNTTQSYSKASALRLTGPSVTATSGFMLGGTTTAADGSWAPKTIETINVSGAFSYVSVPGGSAVVLTYENGVAQG
jgi:glycosyl hydrolase family 30